MDRKNRGGGGGGTQKVPHHSLGPSSLHALTCLIVHIHCPYDIVQIERLQTENRSLKAETSKLCGQLEALARRCRRYRARRAKMARFQSENANMWE